MGLKNLFVCLLFTGILLCSCRGANEPVVPTSSVRDEGEGIVFPVDREGEIDKSQLAELAFEYDTHDFGEVEEGTIVKHRFTFTNVGQQPLLITHARSTCGCTVPQYPEEAVAPGDTASVFVVFDTAEKAGPQNKPVTITANTYPNTTTIQLVGTVNNLN